MRDFRKLIVWQKRHRLTLEVHSAVCTFPRRNHSGLPHQITRAAASIPATLAEGCGKSTDGELARFTDMSLASAKELENHLILARDPGLLDADTYDRLDRHLDEVRRMLFAFAVAVRSRDAKKKRRDSGSLEW